MSTLTPEQRELITETARTLGGARAMLEALRGLGAVDASAVLLVALTTLIEVNYAPAHRLEMLNALLGPTVFKWAQDAADAPGRSVQ